MSLALSRRYGQRITLFNPKTNEKIGDILVEPSRYHSGNACIIFEGFDESIGIHREEIYKLYQAEQQNNVNQQEQN